MAKKNNGAPGIDGVTFAASRQVEWTASSSKSGTNWSGARIGRCGTGGGDQKGRGQGPRPRIPAIRSRVVQAAPSFVLEPVFEADFQDGSFGYRPKRTAHAAVHRVAEAIVRYKASIIDIDLKAYYDNVRHQPLLAKVGPGSMTPT